jgi:hypothetical protein
LKGYLKRERLLRVSAGLQIQRSGGGSIQAVTKEYVQQQFNAAIGRNVFTIRNDGTLKSITVFLLDGSNFKLDLFRLAE